MNWIRNQYSKFSVLPQKQRVLLVSFSVGVIVLTLSDKFYFSGKLLGALNTFEIIAAGVGLSALMIFAGVAVMRALFHVAAGLSLLIFLAQSYCEIPSRTSSGNSALQLLLAMGLLYIVFDFGSILYSGLKEYFVAGFKPKDPVWSIIFIGILFLMVVFFVWAVFQVVSPIFRSLCVY